MQTWVKGRLINPEELEQDDDGDGDAKQPEDNAFHDNFRNKGYGGATSAAPARLPYAARLRRIRCTNAPVRRRNCPMRPTPASRRSRKASVSSSSSP